METHILVVEDDAEIREGVAIYLKNQGYTVHGAANGAQGLELARQLPIHLAVVDVMMPVMDGITMVMKLRDEGCEFPVIMLSAKSEDIDKITGLNIGADDYVTKPFVPMELLARVHSHLRRYEKFLRATGAAAAPTLRTYVIGGLELCEDTAELTVDGTPVKLTPLEFKILALLMKNPGRVFSAEEIYERVWNERAVSTDTIMVHIRNIREKIEYKSQGTEIFESGVGHWVQDRKVRRPRGCFPHFCCWRWPWGFWPGCARCTPALRNRASCFIITIPLWKTSRRPTIRCTGGPASSGRARSLSRRSFC